VLTRLLTSGAQTRVMPAYRSAYQSGAYRPTSRVGGVVFKYSSVYLTPFAPSTNTPQASYRSYRYGPILWIPAWIPGVDTSVVVRPNRSRVTPQMRRGTKLSRVILKLCHFPNRET
jgi:hypothetical protein